MTSHLEKQIKQFLSISVGEGAFIPMENKILAPNQMEKKS